MEKNILVIEHSFGFRIFVDKLFKSKGYKVFHAGNDYQALDIIYRKTIDIILLDTLIPGNGAIGVIDRLSKDRIHIPIIALTTRETDLYGPLIDLQEVKSILEKPFDPPELELLIERLIREYPVTHSERITIGNPKTPQKKKKNKEAVSSSKEQKEEKF